MTKSFSQLESLIHSLDSGEKRFFRGFAKRHVTGEDNEYLQLFEVMQAATGGADRNAEAPRTPPLPPRRLALAKNYLQQMVLQSLRRQHRGKSLSMYFREQLDYIELLFQKGQSDLCLRWITRTKKKAFQMNENLVVLDLIRWEKRLRRSQAGKLLGERLLALVKEEMDCLEELSRETTLQGLRDQLFGMIVQRANPRLPAIRLRLEEIAQHPLVAGSPLKLGHEAALAWHFIHVYVLQMRAIYDQVLPHYRAMFEIWENCPGKKRWEAQRYINTLYLYLDNCLASAKIEEFETIFSRIQDFQPREPKGQALKFHFLMHLRLRFYLNTRSFESAMALENEIQAGLKKHQKYINPNVALGFYYNLAVTAFILENFSAAVRWVNRIVHHQQISVRQDLQSLSRILLLIFHFELGNTDLLPTLIPSSKRYLARRPEADTFANSLFKWLNKLSRTPEPERKPIWLEFRKDIHAVMTQLEVDLICREEILSWLESRCKGQSIREVLATK